MKNILVVGSTGQIGSELTMKLRSLHPDGDVVAGYVKGAEPKGELLESVAASFMRRTLWRNTSTIPGTPPDC